MELKMSPGVALLGPKEPCTQREALREGGMSITQWCLLNGGDKVKCLYSIQKAESGFVKDQVAFLL